ncbi:hypothetical protein SUGI_0232930 [Cryptomeria japonica]|uniref:putative receptor-like protein kinase At3g47110 n=1 Tax=Cryptomeria japonica TaxID=3369 RepID=UPI002408983E|nr:putative receptor-like protein kinase At3g47110 [Cryptomeria japonica]GLJ14414.1 hypothetical protein SUGI_0232930 [Cryptomeria japonica]
MHNLIRVVLLLCLLAEVKINPMEVAAAGSRGSERDVASLMEFKNSVTQDPLAVLHTWNQSLNFCNWTGIRCNTEKWRVVRLDLGNMSLQGVLPPQLGNLSFLHYLDLSFNRIGGQIPSALGRLRRLNFLYLHGNLLEGSVPHSLGTCLRLRELHLSRNNLNGSLPWQLGNLPNLQVLTSWANCHSGSIPAALGNCSMLRLIDLSDNDLEGTIPSQIGSLTKLEVINLDNNRISGEIPTSVLNCTELRNLSLVNNSLSGVIPSEIGVKLSKLEYLVLPQNKLSGVIPKSLGNCSRLSVLELAWNELSGVIPQELGNLLRLTTLNLFCNHFVSGSGSANGVPILNALINCSLLKRMDLTDNYLEGILPPSLGLLSPFLSTFSLESNHIRGNIPHQIGNLTGLTELYLGGNSLDEAIPSAIARLPNLQMLNISRNQLEGPIPMELGMTKRLVFIILQNNSLSGTIPKSLGSLELSIRQIDLSINRLNGSIPPELGNCSNLELLDVSYNRLTGNIPLEVANLHYLQLYFNLSNNQLTGPVPGLLGGMQMVQAIDLSSNKLLGPIPQGLSGCVELEYLNLSQNKLQGTLPASFGNQLKSLQDIDLSFNNLSGLLPTSLGKLEIQHLNLSYNHFSGPVPCSGAYKQQKITSFLGNPQLCGKWLGLQDCPQGKRHGSVHKGKLVLLISILAVSALSCLAAIGFWITFRNKRSSSGLMRKEDLSRATEAYNPRNLIGSGSLGSVYRGVLPDGKIVAIKVLTPKRQEADDCFQRECQTLLKVAHPNLVKIIGSYSEAEFKALVLEFVPNGNLDKHLHRDSVDSSEAPELSLRRRWEILFQIARAVSYLHHDCSPAIVHSLLHCDIKPQNVLLDESMRVRVADFGIAQLVNDASAITSTLRGSFGYIAPEYGMGGRISVKGDVYSYGVVVLEMLTQKRPTDPMFANGLTLSEWVSHSFPHSLKDIVAADLVEEIGPKSGYGNSMVEGLLQLGLSCTSQLPHHRPSMAEVVMELNNWGYFFN